VIEKGVSNGCVEVVRRFQVGAGLISFTSVATIFRGFVLRIVWSTLVKASNALPHARFWNNAKPCAQSPPGADPVPPVVGRLDSVLAEKPQHMSFVVLGTHPVQQRLIVLVA